MFVSSNEEVFKEKLRCVSEMTQISEICHLHEVGQEQGKNSFSATMSHTRKNASVNNLPLKSKNSSFLPRKSSKHE